MKQETPDEKTTAPAAEAAAHVDHHEGDGWTVTRCDALVGLGRLEAHSAGLVLMDPPYCSGGWQEAGQMRAKMQGLDDDYDTFRRLGWFAADNMSTAGLVWLLREVASEAHRILTFGGSLLTFCDWRQVPNLAPALESTGLRYMAQVIWDKGSAGLGTGFRSQYEAILHFVKGVGRFHDEGVSNVIRCSRVRAQEREHPTEKPIELLERLISVACAPDAIVVDPFCGSGTTGIAARKLGRRFIGFDRELNFSELTARRLDGAPRVVEGQLEIGGEVA